MKNLRQNNNIFELDKNYSTTRRITKQKPIIENKPEDKVKTQLFLPAKPDRKGEGGLRTQGYFKHSEKDKPLISVITVVFNGEKYLEQTIQSVIKQTYDNVEYIIIDGGSEDGTLGIIKKYEGMVDYWVSEPDQGIYDAMNKGLNVFSGEWVLFLGSDDYLFNIFQKIINKFQKKTVSYYGNVILSKSKKIYTGKFYPLKLFIKNIPHQAIFYSKYVFNEYTYNMKYITVADYELNLKIFSNKKYGFKYISNTIANYNNENGLSSIVNDDMFSLDKSKIIYKHYPIYYYVIYILVRFILNKKL